MSSWKKFIFLFFKKIKLYDKKILKNEISIKNENITSLRFEFRTNERLLKGKNPPDEINVIDKLKESRVLNPKIFKIKKIKKVKIE